jgi:hypothetical protein
MKASVLIEKFISFLCGHVVQPSALLAIVFALGVSQVPVPRRCVLPGHRMRSRTL